MLCFWFCFLLGSVHTELHEDSGVISPFNLSNTRPGGFEHGALLSLSVSCLGHLKQEQQEENKTLLTSLSVFESEGIGKKIISETSKQPHVRVGKLRIRGLSFL